MGPQEFATIAADMQGRWWSFPIPASAFDQYVSDLADLPADKVAAAVEAFGADGRDRPPTSGQIRRRIAELQLDVPTWDEARVALVAWRRRPRSAEWECPDDLCDGSGIQIDEDAKVSRNCSCRPAMLEARLGLGDLPPLVREFVADGHMTPAEFDEMLMKGDTTAEAQIRSRWMDFTRRAVDSQVLAGLPAGRDMPRIEAARAEAEDRDRRFSAPHKLDVAGLLGRGSA